MIANKVKERLYQLGADMCKIASIDRFFEAPEGYHPLDVLPTCKSVIVFANRFLAGTLACKTAVPYTVVRNILTDRMDKIAVQFCLDLEKEGILAVPTRTNGSEWDEKTGRFRSIVSAKHAAQAAGLGTIGRHSLLITPEYGSMVWLSVILTEIELEPDALQKPICNACNLCVEVCPVHALDNDELNQSICWDYAFGEVKMDWQISCHKCRDICPYNLGTKNIEFKRALNERREEI
jgi:epoxyqueuosine reductase